MMEESLMHLKAQGFSLDTPECVYLREILTTLNQLNGRATRLEHLTAALKQWMDEMGPRVLKAAEYIDSLKHRIESMDEELGGIASILSSRESGAAGGPNPGPTVEVQKDQYGTEWKRCYNDSSGSPCDAWSPVHSNFCTTCGWKFPTQFVKSYVASTKSPAANSR